MKNLIFIILIISNIVFAQTSPFPIVTTSCEMGQCTWADFIATVQKAIRAILILAFWLASILGIVGAIMMMLGGAMKTLETGKKILFTATIGYAILLSAGIIFDLFLDFIKPKLYIPQ
ncbi:MAG: hypothetical protein ACP5JU_00100 [Minisyncoccia bacterium]